MKKISIVIPTYNRKEKLKYLLKTLLPQEQFLEEIIIVDDGSTDGTYEEIKSWPNPKITIYKIKNSERGFARNYGAYKAKGSYINFFDSDDYAYHDHCRLALEIAKKEDSPPWIITSHDIKNINSEKYDKCPTPTNPILKNLEDGNTLSINSIFIRKDISKSFFFNDDRDLSGSEDYELWIRLALNYEPVISPISTTVIVNHSERSVTSIHPEKALKAMLLFIHLIKNNKSFQNLRRQKRRIISSLYSYLTLHLSYSPNHRKLSIYYCCQALKWSFNLLSLKKTLVCLRNIIYKMFYII